ncbi:xanthine dehydrogenase family protein molybdopterin-binding subunit [Thalassobium sp. R2A62]|uniref:xanthine dehydrogenase family protein molybdopterin-binding subunit n=1 Tax=Thalassobium sp. R2A62 TaxID=633131 RepID=UPI0001B1D4E2|nr:xanthine dehydrogenase family protein molybdopterin-binding subunit [Thalassobium sp. R2A62]EET49484.1 carbon monoxide dehydrogenase large chain [Thalassobium sp. R2A62]
MDKFGKSQSVKRIEDLRFLTGSGRYVDDITPAGALHTFVLRSPVAHAEVTELNVSDARTADGVHLVLTAQDLIEGGLSKGMRASLVKNLDGSEGADPRRPLLAEARVRFVGEPIAVIVADTMEHAKDASELIVFDFEELETHVKPVVGGPEIHPEAPQNIAFDWGTGEKDATEAAFADAVHHVTLELDDNRVIVNSMEPRGCYAEMTDGRLHVSVNGQGVWGTKTDLADILDMDEADIRVTNPDVGGGFGMKAMNYAETFLVAFAARALGRPVRWMSERTEAMLSDNAGRDLIHVAELAFDADHRITGYRINTVANMGAYNSQYAQPIQTMLFSRVLMGVYDVQSAWMRTVGVYTNTTQVDAYRGAGRPEAIYALERAMDTAARQLGVDPWDLRAKNFIKPNQFPYKTVTDETYDVGDFDRLLGRAAVEADRDGFAARRAASAAKGKLRGLGLCYYIESILGDPSEGAEIVFLEDGTVEIYVGTQSNGQGHETVYAQFLSDQTGIPADRIVVIQGDSDRIKQGGGTGGSRSVTVQNNATLATVTVMVEAFGAFLSETEDNAEVTFDDERFRVEGSNTATTMLEAAQMARDAGRDDLLKHAARATLEARSYPNGAHVAEVEIDPETGQTRLDRYTVVDDFGNLINPMLAAGQVHGGVVQGVGQALQEHVAYDAEGQLLTATFMDYSMPRAEDVPMIKFHSEPVPSTNNIMGMKGCGEAGTVGSMAATANAVQDALWDRGITHVDMPLTPLRVWEMLQEAPVAAE